VSRRIRRLFQRAAGVPEQESSLSSLTAEERDLISRIRSRRLTFLSDAKLASLASTVRGVEDARLTGVLVEAGCALGGSSILIASIKAIRRPLFVYDTFEMIPPPTRDDPPEVHERYRTIAEGNAKGIGGDEYYGYVENLYDVVRSNFRSLGVDCETRAVSLVKGLIQETLLLDGPVAFAHVDVDWYEPVKTCLERLFPKLVVGGSLILDDYHSWGGCRKAVDEYFRGLGREAVLDDSSRSMKVTRVAAPS
jgi:asparagine synthase (glutamine-hydrolysing)